MTEKLNTAEPAREKNKNLIVAAVVAGVAIVALVVAIIFYNLGKGEATPPEQTPSVEASAGAGQGSGQDGSGQGGEPGGAGQGGSGQGDGGQGGQGSQQGGQGARDGGEQVNELGPVDPQQKALIEAQWRLDADDPLAVGDLDADLLVQIYYDYRCGYCAMSSVELEPELQSLVDDGTIRIEYTNLPVLGEESMLAAQGSIAAANQGKFFEYHEHMFANQYDGTPVTVTEDGLADVAREIGVADIDKFVFDLTSDSVVGKVQGDRTRGTQGLGITGTPAFIIGYSYVPGFIPYDTFIQVVDAELARPVA